MLLGREQANEGSVAVWDRLYAHLTFLISHDTASIEQLADIFAPLLISYDSQPYNPHSVNQVSSVGQETEATVFGYPHDQSIWTYLCGLCSEKNAVKVHK